MTGQQAALQKNSPRQWGRSFGRAPREICPAISTHSHWGVDCTTTMRWQNAGADASSFDQPVVFFVFFLFITLILCKLKRQNLQKLKKTYKHLTIRLSEF